MTIPNERRQAVITTRDFLRSLLNAKKTPRVPKSVRQQALRCLRHYPGEFDVAQTARNYPEMWGTWDGMIPTDEELEGGL